MTGEPLRLLVAESEPPQARETRRASVGRSAGESYQALLERLVPGARCTRVKPADAGAALPDGDALAGFDAVFVSGSPLHLYDDTPEARREIGFLRAIGEVGTPIFGSCAGLQVAAVAAGGTVRPMAERREAGVARRIYPTEAGRGHPLLRGRPPAFDAPAIHTDEVAQLPNGARLLASNGNTTVQAAEIAIGEALFWGVQYHPEIDLCEIAAALRRQADDLVEHALAPDRATVEHHAALIDDLHRDPDRHDLRWRLGLDDEVIRFERRTREIANFVDHLVLPTRSMRGRQAAQAVLA